MLGTRLTLLQRTAHWRWRCTRLLSLSLIACGASSACASRPSAIGTSTDAPRSARGSGSPATATAPAAPPARDDGRLPVTALPLRYALTLHIDPTQPRFSGDVKIDVNIPATTQTIVLNARGLQIIAATARVRGRNFTATQATRHAHGSAEPDELVLSFAEKLPPGEATIDISYDAPFGQSLAGLYRVKDGDRWYAFTQFESTDARRAFPCFDEPSYKTPFTLSITTPKGDIAVANAPETLRQENAGNTTFAFTPTRPLPTYLVAFAVGDFDIRQGPATPVPIRLIATKGKGAFGQLALDVTAPLVHELGDYFGVAYPYEKLDIVAVPEFEAGAMENPGLITFREEILLVDPKAATTSLKRRQAEVVAHELAHQWFGDLVTMRWWDDLWLNEGFATWMEAKVVDRLRPSFGARTQRVLDTQSVMDTDALSSARAVRQPVHSTSDAMEAFDGITYEKGAAILTMIEQYIGEETFQRAVRDYIRANAWKNASADDLLHALDAASGKNVTQIASTFLDKPGVPNVAIATECTKGGVTLRSTVSTWKPLGSDRSPVSAPWTVPMCLHVDGSKNAGCSLASPETTARELTGGRCPSWIYPNEHQAGYYRFALDPKAAAALVGVHAQFEPAERIGLAANLWASVRSGALSPATYLDLLPRFDTDPDRHVVSAVLDGLYDIHEALIDDSARPAFRAYVSARLLARKRELGWEPVKGAKDESDDPALLRHSVIRALGELAEDETTLREADKYLEAWLRDPSTVDADTAEMAAELGSRRAGLARLEALRVAAKTAKTPENRILALRAMGGFADPSVLRAALDLTLTDEIRVSEMRYLTGSALSHRASTPIVYDWIKRNWGALRTKLAGPLARGLVHVAAAMCTPQDRDDAQAFFEPRVASVEGSTRLLNESIESASLCIALHDHGSAAVSAYFAKKR